MVLIEGEPPERLARCSSERSERLRGSSWRTELIIITRGERLFKRRGRRLVRSHWEE